MTRRLDLVLSVRLLGAGGHDRLSHAERERVVYDGDATGQRVDGSEASKTRFLEQVIDAARMLLDQSYRVVGEPRRGACCRDLDPIVGELPRWRSKTPNVRFHTAVAGRMSRRERWNGDPSSGPSTNVNDRPTDEGLGSSGRARRQRDWSPWPVRDD